MKEVAVVIDNNGEPIYWHLPEGRSSSSIPDSKKLWDILWENRDNVSGVAHTHPGSGRPKPSQEDITTFSAVESALGRELIWWIVTETHFVEFSRFGPGKYNYASDEMFNGVTQEYDPMSFIRDMVEKGDFDPYWKLPAWVDELREHSYHSGIKETEEGDLKKPKPFQTYCWESVERWLLATKKIAIQDLKEFYDFLYSINEFGIDRGFTITSEYLSADYESTDAQRRVTQTILDEFGEAKDRRWADYYTVDFAGRS